MGEKDQGAGREQKPLSESKEWAEDLFRGELDAMKGAPAEKGPEAAPVVEAGVEEKAASESEQEGRPASGADVAGDRGGAGQTPAPFADSKEWAEDLFRGELDAMKGGPAEKGPEAAPVEGAGAEEKVASESEQEGRQVAGADVAGDRGGAGQAPAPLADSKEWAEDLFRSELETLQAGKADEASTKKAVKPLPPKRPDAADPAGLQKKPGKKGPPAAPKTTRGRGPGADARPVARRPGPAGGRAAGMPGTEQTAPRRDTLPGETKDQVGEKSTVPGRGPAKKGFGALRTAILVVLGLVLSGALLYYFEIVDLTAITGSRGPALDRMARSSGTSQKQTRRAPGKKTGPAERPDQTPPAQRPAAGTGDSKAAAEPTGSPSLSESRAHTVQEPAESPERPRPKPDVPSTAGEADRKASLPVRAEKKPPGAKPAATQLAKEVAGTSGPVFTHYPYAVLMGAYSTVAGAEKGIELYREKYGVEAYWVKVDLGAKGVWYRVFTGYFREMAEAEAFLAKKGIAEARVKRTRYTTLIGRFRGAQELRRRSEQVRELGYSPYVIPGADGTSRLHVGSFFTRAGAQKQKADLAAHGIESRIVDR